MAIDRQQDDPIEVQIDQEVEEFLRDLTLEFPFQEIFETLRRQGFKDKFGKKVFPFPHKRISEDSVKEIEGRVQAFLGDLRKTFGARYLPKIEEAIGFYTEKTLEGSPENEDE